MHIPKRLVLALVHVLSVISQGSADVVASREVFYVGGSYTDITVGDTTRQYMIDQIYVEKLTPNYSTQPYPIVFIAGAGQTGTNFLQTPDDRPGWAAFFLRRGYTVYLTDQPARGRSAWHPSIGSIAPAFSTEDVETLFTATSTHNLWPQSYLHTQWPGSGRAGDPIFDAFYASQVQLQADGLISEDSNTKAYTRLLDKIGKAYLLTHSQAGAYGWRVGDARPGLVKGIIAVEPPGPPFVNLSPSGASSRTWGITDLEIVYEPSAGPNATNLNTITVPPKDANHTECIIQANPPKKLKYLSKVPVLLVTSEASFQAASDYCTVRYLKQAGVDVEYADLGAEGIKGNGHFMFMEKNNVDIATRIWRWLKRH
ncbi:alpha/beta-hydrolase [Lojkania enalia]|uniref:Alpha/beta-hydrolase n=1 Tax=Lojkania enalia TaxID=147567 RepID=A0A9P4NAS0_9PLEO|nr:alpha/beta-hydrolase [Didymosphaeria enalia]